MADWSIQIGISTEPESDLVTGPVRVERTWVSRALKRGRDAAPRSKRFRFTEDEEGVAANVKKNKKVGGGENQNEYEPVGLHYKKGRRPVKGQNPQEKLPPKTSSLFKNNPDVPSISRQPVEHPQEQIFSSASISSVGLHPFLESLLSKDKGLTCLTCVQKCSIPLLLQGKDVLIQSQTGSGKTLAYALPLVHALQAVQPEIKRSDGPYALIIVPTRELALQTYEVVRWLTKPFIRLVPGILMGGEKKSSEKARIRKGINILVSTPGRLVDHLTSTACLELSRVLWLILDEADRLLDLGFEKYVTTILNRVNQQSPNHQSVLLSATLTQGVSQLASISLNSPVTIDISQRRDGDDEKCPGSAGKQKAKGDEDNGQFAVPEGLSQNVLVVPSKLRLVALASFFISCFKKGETKIIVFFSACESVEFHHCLFSNIFGDAELLDLNPKLSFSSDLSWLKLHGYMAQKERREVFQTFTQATAGILLCTDVAARGLDLPCVNWILQYDPPISAAVYVHRAGRTARAGSGGGCVLFLTPAEVGMLDELSSHGISLEELKVEEVLESLLQKEDFFRGRKHVVTWDVTRKRATDLQVQFESFTASKPAHLQQARKAFQSYIRAYATFPTSLRHAFNLRSLHLGHVAKSFTLREAPGAVACKTDVKYKDRVVKQPKRLKHKMDPRSLMLSEYESGL
uniref:ATP-dependent DNA helicase DDX31-like isoform X2 n=1 Tax=Myxine glutinosa TaxID=7769 RepID=UPI00358F95BF